MFTGTVRDHAQGRDRVEWLEYEAYEEQAVAKMGAVAATAREKWPGVERIAILHRTGRLEVTDTAVVVAVSAPHRDEAFEAARFCIDTLKAEAPIWKKERWAAGEAWGHSEARQSAFWAEDATHDVASSAQNAGGPAEMRS